MTNTLFNNRPGSVDSVRRAVFGKSTESSSRLFLNFTPPGPWCVLLTGSAIRSCFGSSFKRPFLSYYQLYPWISEIIGSVVTQKMSITPG